MRHLEPIGMIFQLLGLWKPVAQYMNWKPEILSTHLPVLCEIVDKMIIIIIIYFLCFKLTVKLELFLIHSVIKLWFAHWQQ